MLRSKDTLLLACLTVGTLATGQSAAAPRPQPSARALQQAKAPARNTVDGHLVRVETITSPTEIAAAFYPPLRCDSDGNLYLRTDSGSVPAIHKLNAKGEKLALFEVSSNPDLKDVEGHDFALDVDGGELYELVYPGRYVFVYKSDGTFKTAVKLKPGFPFSPKKISVFASGQFLISGEKYDANLTGVGWPFTGIFAADGSLLKELEIGDERDLHEMAASGDTLVAPPDNAKGNRAVDNGQVEIGSDWNAYVMRWTNPAIFYAISPGGEVVRRFAVDPAESVYRPAAMHVHKNRIAVLFVKKQSDDKLLKVVDLEGQEIANYDEFDINGKAQGAMSAAFACYTENPTRFVFLGANDDNKIQFWIAGPR